MASTGLTGPTERTGLLRSRSRPDEKPSVARFFAESRRVLRKYLTFVGPGFLVSVAYIDPGNYATDVAAGATFRFRLLFTVLLSNVFAIVLQSLSIKLGIVTGQNLAENCKAHLPRWLNYVLYAFAEVAIIATDVSEVIGTAISLSILFGWPLVVGCAVSILDVLLILIFYKPTGMTMKALRIFEGFVMVLVLGVVVCFVYLLSLLKDATLGDVMRGFLPSWEIMTPTGLYQSCGILGATVMPHSLYLGSGIVQARLHEHDNYECPDEAEDNNADTDADALRRRQYKPSLAAIRTCLSYSLAENAVSLLTFALFVNAAILIVAGSALYSIPDASNGDIFLIHSLLSSLLSPLAGTVFALSLLLSGTSAGVVCTIAGQMVGEGQLDWKVHPALRRLITRSISIVPSFVVALLLGREGMSIALEGSQVVLSAILPFVTAPLIWFTCSSKIMTVSTDPDPHSVSRLVGAVGLDDIPHPGLGADHTAPSRGNLDSTLSRRKNGTTYGSTEVDPPGDDDDDDDHNSTSETSSLLSRLSPGTISMRNSSLTTFAAVVVWAFVVILNSALLVLMALGLTW